MIVGCETCARVIMGRKEVRGTLRTSFAPGKGSESLRGTSDHARTAPPPARHARATPPVDKADATKYECPVPTPNSLS